jgi:group I intron endonuclease
MTAYGFIYLTTNTINGNRYIGQCSYVRNKHWQTYLGSGIHLKSAIKKHGKENFIREILCNAFTKDDLNFLETYFITEFNAVEDRAFYNVAKGATSTGGFRNKTHTDETKTKIREKCQDRVISEKMKEHCRNIGKAKKTQEQIEKHRAAISGDKHFRAKGVTIDEVFYPTITAAHEATGISRYKIVQIIDGQ